MREATRARIAAVVAAASQRKSVTWVLDHAAGEHKNIQVRVGDRGVAGFDHTTSSQFSGPPGTSLNFRDHDEGKQAVKLSLNGAGFFGFDFDTSQHFSGTVAGNVVMVYDYETSAHYKFSA